MSVFRTIPMRQTSSSLAQRISKRSPRMGGLVTGADVGGAVGQLSGSFNGGSDFVGNILGFSEGDFGLNGVQSKIDGNGLGGGDVPLSDLSGQGTPTLSLASFDTKAAKGGSGGGPDPSVVDQ